MRRNIGLTDMAVRLAIGGVLLYLGLGDNPVLSAGLPKTIVAIAALVPLLTGVLRFCPIYFLAGINTITARRD
jgi:hypothetical protein